MSRLEQNSENYVLDVFRQAIDSYEQLQKVMQQPQQFGNNMAKELLQACYNHIETLINLEFNYNTINPFHRDIRKSLCLLQNNIINLQEQQGFVSNTKTIPKSSSQIKTQNSTTEEDKLKEVIKSTQVVTQVGLKDIAGLDNVKKQLMTAVILPIYQPQLYTNQKITNSILLYGPPGTGKTKLAHALATEASACLFSVNASNILSRYVGESEKMLRALFTVVKEPRNCPTILFMDEIDGLCQHRNSNEHEWSRRFKTELMCHLSSFEDCRNAFLICSTNHPWDLDSAFLRRFQQRIYVPLPLRPERFDLLKLFTKDTSLENTSTSWNDVLNRTQGYSGSDLADVVRMALTNPITELIGNTMWKRLSNNTFVSMENNDDPEYIVTCKITDLPHGSIRARSAQVCDLIMAIEKIKRTVSNEDCQKYEMFLHNE